MSLKTADLCDACADVQVCALPWRGYGQRRAFAGRIRTVRAGRDMSRVRDMVNQPGHDQVLVVDGGGSLAHALLGDVLGSIAVRNGWAGCVIHGAVRDTVELASLDIGVKALGTAPRRADRLNTGEIDVPLYLGGVNFVPGQRLVADDDGVVLLPPGLSETAIAVESAMATNAAYALTGDGAG